MLSNNIVSQKLHKILGHINEIHDLRNNTCSPCLHSLVNIEANIWENPETPTMVFTSTREF